MSRLSNLLNPPTREPAACLIELGEDRTNPGPLNALVKSIEIATSRTDAAAATIIFEDRRTEDGTFMVADSGLFYRWQPIRLTVDFSLYQEEILRGYITGLKPNFPASGGEVTLELSILDESALLERDHMRKVWGSDVDTTDLMILSELTEGTGITPDPESGDGQKARSLSQDGPALPFLRDRAAANGYELLFTPGAVYFGPKRLEGEAQAPIMVYAGRATNCLSFGIEDDGMKPDAVTYEVAPVTDGATPETETLEPAVPSLGSTPAAQEGSGLGQRFVARLSRSGDEPPEATAQRAQAMADEAAFKLRANGELDGSLYGHVLRPGALVPVDGTGVRYGGLYYTDKVTHQFTEQGYRQQFELMRNATGEDGGLAAAIAGSSGPLKSVASALTGLF
ncbi:phage late control D family protein [Palleronia caenipelagi]|uniref:Phage late control D family protein n=1 Tax=Palleronia caenipelagi TaxID=2489174 RepID=A0A547PPR3_9RHOB|nr:hypothetical protein [Palleronia caenipelagi]TRD16109.1 hypothetical protein FEV53_14590 [Palleronia caenipelagi]